MLYFQYFYDNILKKIINIIDKKGLILAFEKRRFFIEKETRAFKVVMDCLSCDMREAQRYIDKQRLFCEQGIITNKSSLIKGDVDIVIFKPNTKGLKPIFQTNDFALFDKPSGLLVHPKNRNTFYSLTDEVKYLFGDKANIVHRIDKETSGLVLVAKTPLVEKYFKKCFQEKIIKKGYIAIVKGKIKNEIFINEPISLNRDYKSVKIKVKIDSLGKKAQTIIKPIKYIENLDVTVIEALPLTGRQHQIRVHLFHVKHPIVGDPIYGTTFEVAEDYLDGKLSEKKRILLTGSNRLLLHACRIEFEYKYRYLITSTNSFKKVNIYDKIIENIF